MKKIFLQLMAIVSFIAVTTTYACPGENLDVAKKQLIQYHDSGKYEADENQVIAQAKQYLQTRFAEASQKKLAIVLDIDETSLSNYNDMLAFNFGGKLKDILEAEGNGKDTPIKSTLDLYNDAKAHHISVFFLTGRPENYRQVTIKNLTAAGYKNWDGLILKSPKYKDKSAAVYKTAERKKLTEAGYDIILNVGDQESDLAGGYADKTFKLPNPYYLIP